MDRIGNAKEKFTKYVTDNFDMNNQNIKRKFTHSFRVSEMAKQIAKIEGFTEEDIETATIAGLLHDYARFFQYTKYNTFYDVDSIDHGAYAVLELFQDEEIENFSANVYEYDEIYDAIKFHNKKNIPNNLSDHNKKILEVIRDADKLDNLYMWSVNKALVPNDNS